MEFKKVIKSRHSVRSFNRKDVERSKVRKILELANAAPSAGNGTKILPFAGL